MKQHTIQTLAVIAFTTLLIAALSLAACDPFSRENLGAAGDTNFTNVVASGDITAGDDLTVTDDSTLTDDVAIGGDLTVTGVTYTYLTDLPKTASYTITAANRGALLHNTGATGEITFTLPSAAQGLHYCFYVSAAYTITIDPATGDQVHHLTNSAGDRVQNTGTAGDSVCIQAVDATYWLPTHETGTWADAN